MIVVEGLSKRFGSKTAIADVSFSASRGEVLGFLGPNGAGKTTTLRILAGLIPPSAGHASIDGHDTVRDSLAARRRVGYLPERVPLYDEMRVADFLEFAASMKGLAGRGIGVAIARVADETNLADVLREPIGRLSRGYRQRVGLAQALLADPAVLLLDEPTAGLDPQQIAETRALVSRLAGERTILFSTHILPEVSAICGRVIILARGRVVAVDTPDALAARLSGGRRVEVVIENANGASAAAGAVRALAGVHEVNDAGAGRLLITTGADRDIRPEIAAAVLRAGGRLLEIRGVEHSLEEVFLDLVVDESAASS
ncbi:MAG: ABC transporter ATP-binding protein [bacterium]